MRLRKFSELIEANRTHKWKLVMEQAINNSAFAQNLDYELNNSDSVKTTRALMVAIGEELGTQPQRATIHRWVKGNNLPQGDNLRALANIFGYHDKESILCPDHIANREAERESEQQWIESNRITSPPAQGSVEPPALDLLPIISRSHRSTPEQALQVAENAMKTDPELSAYLKIAIYWITGLASPRT